MKRFVSERDELIASAEPGNVAARQLSDLTDEAVRDLARTASSRLDTRWAVVAVGGWGSGALMPHSDLDILVMSDAPEKKIKPFVEAVLYPLWDAGLKVGHQVRSPREQLKGMRADIKSCTAGLTARVIAGNQPWAHAGLTQCTSDARRHRDRILDALRTRTRPGSPYLLEPDLKDGAGGRRDFDEMTWTAALLEGTVQHDPSALVGNGMMTPDEYRALSAAADTVAVARWLGHRFGSGDWFAFEIAESMRDDADAVNAALGTTALMLARVRARVAGNPTDPALDLAPMHPPALFDLLHQGEDALPALELAAQAGRLDPLVPGFSTLMALRRPGLGHRLTVGAHSLATAASVTSTAGDHALSASLGAIKDPRALQAAALVHDAGKVDGGAGHAVRGAPVARDAALALGLGEQAANEAAELVALHLALAETAFTEDLDDEDTVLRCAARVGRRELVAPLHLLTAADSKATGTATWSPWTAALVARLVSRIDAALSPDADGAGLMTHAVEHRDAALTAMSGALDAERAFVEAAPLRYLASREPREIARDAHLVAGLTAQAGAEQSRIAVSTGPADGTHQVTVIARDRPRLLARIAGAMALAGLDILSVDAYGGTGGVALDSFVVTSVTDRPVSTETFSSLERLLDAALKDRLELVTRLSERRRHYPPKAVGGQRVTVEQSGWDTTVTVQAPDRPGLLHDLADAVYATGLDIRWARAQTIGGMVRDTFHVVGEDGGPVDDPGVLGHLSMRLRSAL
ncbi:MAG: HD domain-containing protein [Coriobacteriia bacterium]|nr:HD domain-containing protein [Coriobacteriia bacterium]